MQTHKDDKAKENQLAVIVKESQLETTKAQYILEQFQDYFAIASEWETRAKAIVVTSAVQTADMKMARVGRLFLKEKRIAVEKVRVKLKEQALREGKAIDGISNVLKALIVPVEDYLERQERFVEIKEEEKKETMRLEIEKRLEEERIAKEKAEAEERERIRQENEKLKKEAEEREHKMAQERKKQATKLAKERAKAEEERRKHEEKLAEERRQGAEERKKIEEKARKEREEQEKRVTTERAKMETERKKAEEKARKEREIEKEKADIEHKEKERLNELLKNQVVCPKCGHKFLIKKA